jgi:hypothetical protein
MTLQVSVATSSDDAKEKSNGVVLISKSDLEFTTDQLVGIRFTGIGVPQGATISSASVQFQALEVDSEITSLIIEGQASDSAPTFTVATNDISSRPRTTAFAAWSPLAWATIGEAGPNQQTSDISSVIQEIVDRTGWSSGNSLVVIITGSGNRVAESFDGDSGAAAAPLLRVTYSTATGTPTPTATPGVTPTATPTATPTPTPTPEPGVILQLVSGAIGLALLNKRRNRSRG